VSMQPFATPAEVAARWRPFLGNEDTTAGILVQDASAMIRVRKPEIDELIEVVPPATRPRLDPTIPKIVVCAMVKRAMLAAGYSDGIATEQTTGGPYSQTLTYTNPSGNLYLTKSEKQDLGIGAQAAFAIDTAPCVSGVHADICALRFGALYCSCGASLTLGLPLYEV
jgi:hypothetical protein